MAAGRRAQVVAILSLVLAALFWAGNYVVGAAVVEAIDPLSLVLLRWALAAPLLFLLAQWVERPDWREVWRSWPWLIALGLTGILGYAVLLYAALAHTSAVSASLINAFNPALITLAAAVVLRTRITPLAGLGVFVALVGVLIVLTDGDPAALAIGFGPGELLMLGAICTWTVYTILGRFAPKVPPIASTAVQALLAAVVLLPVSLATGGPALPGSAGEWWALGFIVIFPSLLSYMLWNRALTVVPPSRAGVFLNLITVFTVVITVMLGTIPSAAQLIGGAIVILGVVLTNVRSASRSLRNR